MVSQSEYGLDETTRGLKKLDLTDQELKDLEVARKIQEEEIKVRTHHLSFVYGPSMSAWLNGHTRGRLG